MYICAIYNILCCRSKEDGDLSVRTCVIHFYLSFLICGEAKIMQTLLEKKSKLAMVMHGLHEDSADTISLVLSTLKDKLVENPG